MEEFILNDNVLDVIDPDDVEFIRFVWLLSEHYNDAEAYQATEEDRINISEKYGILIVFANIAIARQMRDVYSVAEQENEPEFEELVTSQGTVLDSDTMAALMCDCPVCRGQSTFH